jgi:hypothetical protein
MALVGCSPAPQDASLDVSGAASSALDDIGHYNTTAGTISTDRSNFAALVQSRGLDKYSTSDEESVALGVAICYVLRFNHMNSAEVVDALQTAGYSSDDADKFMESARSELRPDHCA